MTKPTQLTPTTIAAARQARGWNQTELARLLDVTRVTVWRWEHGQHTPNRLARRALRRLFALNPVEEIER